MVWIKAVSEKYTLLGLLLILLTPMSMAASLVQDLEVGSIGQLADDEEAPFEIIALNEVHKCGGEVSNRFLVFSEDPDVAMRRFMLALEAYKGQGRLTLKVGGCDGSALRAFELRLQR